MTQRAQQSKKTKTNKQNVENKLAQVTDEEDANGNNCDIRNVKMKQVMSKEERFLQMQGKRERSELNHPTHSTTQDENRSEVELMKDLQIDRNEEEETITELVRASTGNGKLMDAEQYSSMRVALGILLRLVLPLANGVVRGIQGIRDVRFLRALSSIAASRQALTSLIAFAANTISMNLSSVQVTYRIDPILKLLKLRKSQDGLESLPDNLVGSPTTHQFMSFTPTPNKRKLAALELEKAPKCCTLNILASPPPGEPIRADIVLIHGLHGSLVNTWKQGLWEKDRRPVEFQRPPKPLVRPPKRPRHSRALVLRPPQKKKRMRYAELQRQSTERDTQDEAEDNGGKSQRQEYSNDFSYVCGEPENIQICGGVEYSFPTFRLRMHDNGRQLDNENASANSKSEQPEEAPKKQQQQAQQKPKLTPNDPNYSKCWPGDWLPLDCPGVRVIAVNYTTDQYLWRPLWKKKEPRTNLVQRAREMAELLIKERVGYGHPIVWVGHSKGGLFVKQIIVDAWESGRPAMAPFWRSARGVFFYSVPHRGSHLASVKAPLLCRSVELIDIEKNSKYLLDLHRRFAGLYHLGHLKIEVFSFVETALTLMSVLYLRIVGVDSADPGIGDVCGIRLDHREICKPRGRDCILYKELVKMINNVS